MWAQLDMFAGPEARAIELRANIDSTRNAILIEAQYEKLFGDIKFGLLPDESAFATNRVRTSTSCYLEMYSS
jgi:phage-related protein